MRISIFGLGYVGAVSLGCLARDGHTVVGVDVDSVKLDLIRNGKTPIIEEGIQDLLADGVRSGRIHVTADAHQAIDQTDLSFVCVGTPPLPDASQNLAAVHGVAKTIGESIGAKASRHVVVIRSTVFPGTVDGAIKPILERHSGKVAGGDFALCFQPEFLREGSSVKDYDNPPFTVVGSDSQVATAAVRELFGHLPGDFFTTTVRAAEMLKYCCNTFHAVKITFANEMGRLCQAFGVDSHEVMRLACEDRQLNISAAYLRPGFAFGGSCLPKDLRTLVREAVKIDAKIPLLSSVMASNQVHIDHAVQAVLDTKRNSVGMLGLSFKTGTDDLRESPLVSVAEQLIGKGVTLKVYDPEVSLSRLIGANRRYIQETIPHIAELMCGSCEELVDGSEVLIVGLQDQELIDIVIERARDEHIVLDLVGLPHRSALRAKYLGVCW